MSKHGKGIINRLHPLSNLRNEKNDGHVVIDNTIGEYLDRFEKRDIGKQLFLLHATGKYLDLHGLEKGIARKTGESDEVYRNRIIIERGMHNSISDFKVRGVDFWCYVSGLGAGSTEFFIQTCDEDGMYVRNADVTLTVEDSINNTTVIYKAKTNVQGMALFNIPVLSQLNKLNYTVYVNEEYNHAIGDITLNPVNYFKQNTIITCNDMDIVRHNDFSVQLLTTEGTSLANKDVIITVNGIAYPKKTDVEGVAKLQINLFERDYEIGFEFKGDDDYNGCNGSTVIKSFSVGADKKNLYVNSGLLNDIHSSEITSKNVYMKNKYLCHSTLANQMNLQKKFLNGGEITWF